MQSNLSAFQRCPARILVLLDGIATRRDPSLTSLVPDAAGATPASAETASSVPAGAVASISDVAAALAAVAGYFSRAEPSNPALLLVRQAEGLMGKSFLEVMRMLVPNHVEQAAIQIGKDQLFDLPLERLSPFAEIGVAAQPPDEQRQPNNHHHPPLPHLRSRRKHARMRSGCWSRLGRTTALPSPRAPFHS